MVYDFCLISFFCYSNADMYNNYSNEEFVDDDFEYLLST